MKPIEFRLGAVVIVLHNSGHTVLTSDVYHHVIWLIATKHENEMNRTTRTLDLSLSRRPSVSESNSSKHTLTTFRSAAICEQNVFRTSPQ